MGAAQCCMRVDTASSPGVRIIEENSGSVAMQEVASQGFSPKGVGPNLPKVSAQVWAHNPDFQCIADLEDDADDLDKLTKVGVPFTSASTTADSLSNGAERVQSVSTTTMPESRRQEDDAGHSSGTTEGSAEAVPRHRSWSSVASSHGADECPAFPVTSYVTPPDCDVDFESESRRRVHFALSPTHSVHESEHSIPAYSEIYGMPPAEFEFDASGRQIGVAEGSPDQDEGEDDSEEETDEEKHDENDAPEPERSKVNLQPCMEPVSQKREWHQALQRPRYEARRVVAQPRGAPKGRMLSRQEFNEWKKTGVPRR